MMQQLNILKASAEIVNGTINLESINETSVQFNIEIPVQFKNMYLCKLVNYRSQKMQRNGRNLMHFWRLKQMEFVVIKESIKYLHENKSDEEREEVNKLLNDWRNSGTDRPLILLTVENKQQVVIPTSIQLLE